MMRIFFKFSFTVLILAFFYGCQYFSAEKDVIVKENTSAFDGNGLQKKYRDDKTLFSAINYTNKKRHGIARSYYDDGKTVFNEISYDMGVKSGITNSYYKNGKLYYAVNYVDGKRQGYMEKYYDTGELMAKVPYKNSELQVGLIEYQKSGKQKKIYPHIVFEEIDRTASELAYIVRIRLSNNKKKVKFYQILTDEKGDEISRRLTVNQGVAEVKFDIRGKHSLDVKLKIKANFTTFLRNPYIIYKEIQLKAGS